MERNRKSGTDGKDKRKIYRKTMKTEEPRERGKDGIFMPGIFHRATNKALTSCAEKNIVSCIY